jgi:hypothetical protein
MCSDFLDSQFIKNPFTSNRVSFIYKLDLTSVTIQVRHKDSSISNLCTEKIHEILISIFNDNIDSAKLSLIRFSNMKLRRQEILNLESKKQGLTTAETNYILTLNEIDFNNLFINKKEFNKFWSSLQPNQVKKYYKEVRSFNIMLDESNRYLQWINEIGLSRDFYTVKTSNNSIFRIIQIFLTSLIGAFFFLYVSPRLIYLFKSRF